MLKYFIILLLSLSLFSKELLKTPADVPVIGEIEPVLIRLLANHENKDANFATIHQDAELQALIKKHNLQLFNGPMLGCITHNSAKFWVRTSQPAEVHVTVANMISEGVKTTVENDLTAVIEMKDLKDDHLYTYNIRIDGNTQFDADQFFKTYPIPGKDKKVKFDVAFGGCARYISEKEFIWNTIASYNPTALIMTGDNLYIDLPLERNKQNLYYQQRLLRPEFRKLTARIPVYAIWDDHDFGANDSAGGPEKFTPDWKFPVWQVFKNNWNNPAYGFGAENPGCWFDFSIGDVDFFMTDGRYYRDFKNGTMLGPVQKKWLLEKLKKSTAKFKVLVSGTLWTEDADKGGADSWWGVKEEREEIFKTIDDNNITGVFLLSGDRHRADVYKIERPNGYPLYEFENAHLVNDYTHKPNPKALMSYNEGDFFGLLSFDFTLADPEMTYRCITNDNKEVQNFKLKLSQLKKP